MIRARIGASQMLQKVKLKYFRKATAAIIDRLPTAKIMNGYSIHFSKNPCRKEAVF